MTALLYTLGVLLFAVGIAASIALHELGHLVPARRFGVKVTQYFVGFGRTVWSRQRGETEYGLKAVPLGGYVKLVGMLPPEPGTDPHRVRKSNTGMFTQLISDTRAAEYELVDDGDEERLFYRLPWWKKVIVMAGGPTVNLVIAFCLFGGVFMIHGVAEPTLKVDQVSDCVIPVDQSGRACRPSDPVAPAAQAGLRTGDVIVSMNGVRLSDWDQLTHVIRSNDDGQASLVVHRHGRTLTLHTNTVVAAREALNDPEARVKVGFLGVTPQFTMVPKGPGFVVSVMGTSTWETVKALGAMPVRLWGVAKAVAGVEERDPNGPVSVVGASRVAGEVASDQEIPLSSRFANLLILLAGLNLFLGMFNFVPLLPLDGGHIAGALYEGARRGVARLRRRPDPGYVDVARMLPVAYTVAGLLMVMSVLLIYADLVVPVSVG